MRRDILLGTYTWRDAEGIYRGSFDDETGELEIHDLAIAADNPAFLVLRGESLYAVNEQRAGGVSAFRRTLAGLEFVNSQPSGGSLPCHLAAGPGWVAVANYGTGNVTLFPTGEDGSLLPLADSRQHRGSGPNAKRQESAHAHETHRVGPDTLLVPDLGADRIYRYRVADGRLHDEGATALPPGRGPRHVAMHPNLPLLYALNELGNTVASLRWPTMEAVQTIATLPKDFAGESTTAEIQIAPDGRFLHVSNRGHDSIATFAIGPEGRLAAPSFVPTRGQHPRYFGMDPTGRWLIVLNQDSDNAVVYRLRNGVPADVCCEAAAPTPVCLLFP